MVLECERFLSVTSNYTRSFQLVGVQPLGFLSRPPVGVVTSKVPAIFGAPRHNGSAVAVFCIVWNGGFNICSWRHELRDICM
ncbi:hypothetical protein TNCV_1663961 [Trichonephila clavipes]|uniref:Uncharacterized protein n=1 Tax=Trichonephila clavipes TaxID=2585209 RepID=A0A8X6RZS6_TRICX|nr:hypothetical protein TNCV_1663961 [Trichonephila clavipes]